MQFSKFFLKKSIGINNKNKGQFYDNNETNNETNNVITNTNIKTNNNAHFSATNFYLEQSEKEREKIRSRLQAENRSRQIKEKELKELKERELKERERELKEKELKERERELKERELKERERELKEREREPKERERELKERELKERERELKERELKEKEKELKEKEKELKEKELKERELRERQIKEKETELKERELKERELKEKELRDRQIKERELKERELKEKELRDRQIKERELKERQLTEKERQLTERETQLTERERELRDRQIRDRERELKEKEVKERELRDRQIRDRERELKERELKDRERQLTERERELKERERHLTERERELKERERELKERELKEKELKEKELKDRQIKERELKDRQIKEKQSREIKIEREIKEIENVYQEKYNNINASGLGDFIRGSYFLMEFCDKNNISFNINILNHPISQFLEIYQNKKQPSIINNINRFEEVNFQPHISNNDIITNIYDSSTNNKFINYLNKQHVFNKKIYTYIISYPSEKIDENHKEYMKQILKPCKQLELLVDKMLLELQLVKKQFIIIHIRYGDDFLIKKKSNIEKNHLAMIQKILNKLDLNQKYLLISDNIIIKNILSLKYPFIKTHFNRITHTGEGEPHTGGELELETIKLQNTMIDFNMFSHASSVIAFSIYKHGTGFSRWITETYSVPYICRFLP